MTPHFSMGLVSSFSYQAASSSSTLKLVSFVISGFLLPHDFGLIVIHQSPFVSSLSQDLSALVRTENCLPLHIFPNLTSLGPESYRASSFSSGETFHFMAPHRSPMAWMPLGKEPTVGPVSSFGGSRAG